MLFGLVSLFADMTYEGARSITGPYLAVLGASATTVGIVAGAGELLGYGLRLVSGYFSDRTGRYWAITVAGYGINLLAVPLLALAGRWEIAALLMIVERTGKAIRTPARDALLSHATQQVGHGWGFGLHEALDQIGALLGPLLAALVLAVTGEYRAGFAILLIPALLALSTLILVRWRYPRPQNLEIKTVTPDPRHVSTIFWLYLGATALLAAGYADFPLIAYHFERAQIIDPRWIPILYAVAMGVDALAALLCGYFFDRIGLTTLMIAAFCSALFAPLVFLGDFWGVLAGMALWGVGMGAQESILRAAVASMVPAHRRGTAYGLFNTGYGLAWFAGSATMGLLYDRFRPALILFSVVMQGGAVLLLLLVHRRLRMQPPTTVNTA